MSYAAKGSDEIFSDNLPPADESDCDFDLPHVALHKHVFFRPQRQQHVIQLIRRCE